MLRCASVVVGIALATGAAQAFDLQGHRGARGFAPENTLAAFAMALEIGVTTLETDLAVTRDGVIVLSHDPVLNPDIVRGADGAWLSAPGASINTLTLAELKQFDIGRINPASKYASQFPQQKPAEGARFPTLQELFDLAQASGKRPRFNIETKLSPAKPHESLPPEPFARAVVAAVRAAGLTDRVTIQSFDWRTLTATKTLAPEIATVCLTSPSTLRHTGEGASRRPSPWLAGLDPVDHAGSVPRLVRAARCSTWSPHFGDLTGPLIEEAHALGLGVVPWTVNSADDMGRLIDLGVDGLITDYPDRARKVLADKRIAIRQ